MSADPATRRGELTHRIIQDLLPWITEKPRLPEDVMLAVMGEASELGRPFTREQMVLHSYLVTMSRRYLVELIPGRGWSLLGVEYETWPDAGRVDVAWCHADGRVFYDELKTGRQRPRSFSWHEQAVRYATHGLRRYGDAFVGVRALLLASSTAFLVSGQPETIRAIDPTSDAPFRPTI